MLKPLTVCITTNWGKLLKRWGHHITLPAFYKQSSVQLSCSVVSNSLQSHGLQQARLPCPSPTPTPCSNSGPLSQWCHPTISSSVIPFSSCFQSFPASGSFPMSRLFASGGPSIGAAASVLPVNIQDWFLFRVDWFALLAVQGTLKSLLQHSSSKASILWWSAFLMVQRSQPYMNTGKTIALTRWTFVSKVKISYYEAHIFIPLMVVLLNKF